MIASMRFFVTGAAGFIGSNLTDRLLGLGHAVVAYDNFSTGREEFLASAKKHPGFSLVRGDTLDGAHLSEAIRGCDFVYHFAANADVRFGTHHPTRDLHQNTIATVNVLEAMRGNQVKGIAFTSTGSIYGEPSVFPTPENAPLPTQTSVYGASKIAAEGFIQAYCEGFGFRACIFRNVSILGERYTHGHLFDFYKKLRAQPERLDVLGNGKQRKSYLYVQDCIDAMLVAAQAPTAKAVVYNLGTEEHSDVHDSIRWTCEYLKIKPELTFAGGDRGWVGDSPFIFLDCSRIRALGWRPKFAIREGVMRTLAFLDENPWLFEGH
jgi:UDP-glucose 4-epimerase